MNTYPSLFGMLVAVAFMITAPTPAQAVRYPIESDDIVVSNTRSAQGAVGDIVTVGFSFEYLLDHCNSAFVRLKTEHDGRRHLSFVGPETASDLTAEYVTWESYPLEHGEIGDFEAQLRIDSGHVGQVITGFELTISCPKAVIRISPDIEVAITAPTPTATPTTTPTAPAPTPVQIVTASPTPVVAAAQSTVAAQSAAPSAGVPVPITAATGANILPLLAVVAAALGAITVTRKI